MLRLVPKVDRSWEECEGLSKMTLYMSKFPHACLLATSVKGCLGHKKKLPPQDPRVALCVGPHGCPGRFSFSYERGPPVLVVWPLPMIAVIARRPPPAWA